MAEDHERAIRYLPLREQHRCFPRLLQRTLFILAVAGTLLACSLERESEAPTPPAERSVSESPAQPNPEGVETPRESSASESAVPVTEVRVARPARKDPSLNVKAFQTPDEYIELIRRSQLTFPMSVQGLGQDAVGPLLAILGDPEYMEYWNSVSLTIAIVDGEHESSEALLRYVRRRDDWRSHLPEHRFRTYVIGKIAGVGRLGLVGDEETLTLVKSALTVEGARALVSEWFDDCAPHTKMRPDKLLAMVQGEAARAMVQAGDAEGIRQVEDLYTLVSTTKEQSLPETTDVDWLRTRLATVLGIRDLIHDVGMERYLDILAVQETRSRVILRYAAKYRLE